MMRQQLHDLEPSLTSGLLDPASHLQVRHGAVALRDALVGDIADERVLEDELRLPGHGGSEAREHQIARLQPAEQLIHARRPGVERAADRLRPEDSTDHSSRL